MSAVDQHAHELLRIEGVTAGALDEGRLHLGRQGRLLEQFRDQPGRLLPAQRGEVYRCCVPLSACPVWMPLIQFRAGRADKEKWDAFGPIGDVLEKVEECRVCPVEILEDKDRRSGGRECLEETAPSSKRFLPLSFRPFQADQGSEACLQPLPVGLCLRHPPLELGGDRLRGVRLEDARLGLDDLAERPEGDPFPVREAAPLAPGDEIAVLVDV